MSSLYVIPPPHFNISMKSSPMFIADTAQILWKKLWYKILSMLLIQFPFEVIIKYQFTDFRTNKNTFLNIGLNFLETKIVF